MKLYSIYIKEEYHSSVRFENEEECIKFVKEIVARKYNYEDIYLFLVGEEIKL